MAASLELLPTSTFRSERTLPELEKLATYYKCGHLGVQRGANDLALADLYARFVSAGILDRVFYEWVKPPTLYQFLTDYLRSEKNVVACYRQDPQTLQWMIVGIAWTNFVMPMGPLHQRAWSGQAFTKGLGMSETLLLSQMALELAFDTTKVDVFCGSTPVKNRAAVIFVKKMEFAFSGELADGAVWEGEFCPALFSSMTRKRWAEVRPWRQAV